MEKEQLEAMLEAARWAPTHKKTGELTGCNLMEKADRTQPSGFDIGIWAKHSSTGECTPGCDAAVFSTRNCSVANPGSRP